jgi:deazaflavin-dependent oxidoreductase (nitroreductase family)
MEAQPQPNAESIVHRISRVVGTLNLPLAGRRVLPAYAVLYHLGRRSGKAYAVPVWVRTLDDGVVIPMMFAEQTHWARNVLAAGGCTVRWRGHDHVLVDPEVVGPEQVVGAFNPVQRWGLGLRGVRHFMHLRPQPR